MTFPRASSARAGLLRASGSRTIETGFTLIEVMIAMAILAIVVLGMLQMRTSALIDAQEARDWRVAREIAEELLCELRAGARELPPTSGQEVQVEKYPSFNYRFLVGETAIADYEASSASEVDASTGGTAGDRVAWQHQRDDLRSAQQKGVSLQKYHENLDEQNREEKLPSEDESEDVAIVVQFPIRRIELAAEKSFDKFTLKAKVCTMAIQGLTPEKAEAYQKAKGKDPKAPASGAAPAGGGGSGGNSTGKNPGGTGQRVTTTAGGSKG